MRLRNSSKIVKHYCLFSEENNPKTLAVDGKTKLQLALNTTQLGRTFQDRSHVIHLKPRSSLLQKFQNSKIFYIGGMGKRGNIVQTYPAMEYRFTPESITVSRNDVLCFAWSGESVCSNVVTVERNVLCFKVWYWSHVMVIYLDFWHKNLSTRETAKNFSEM